MTEKFDLSSIAESVKEQFKNSSMSLKIGTGNRLRQLSDSDFMKMPDWWQEATGTPGLPYGTGVMLAGKTDSGKTSGALAAIKAAQAQGVAVVYGETENKTTEEDLKKAGVDPSQVFAVRTTVVEEMFDLVFAFWDKFRLKYPDAPLLIVIDSLGNTVSLRDSKLKMTDGKQKPGGKGAGNRLALMALLARMEQSSKVALLLVSYTYANIGAPGRTNAGGEAVNLLCSLIYQTSRRGWIEKAVKGGGKARIGARVMWTLYKNHVFKDKPGPKQVLLDITASGIAYAGAAMTAQTEEQEED